jgi:hypothetical protein
MMSEGMCKAKETISMYNWFVSEEVSKDDASENGAHCLGGVSISI